MTGWDSLTHVTHDGAWFGTGKDASESRLLIEMDRADVERAIVVGLAEHISNDFVTAVCRRHPDRLVPGISINPLAYSGPSVAVSAARTALTSANSRIIKLHPRLNRYDPLDPRAIAFLEEVSTWFDPPLIWLCTLFRTERAPLLRPPVETIHELVVRFPRLNFLLLHAAGTSVLQLVEAIRTCPNAYVDISFTLCRYERTSVWLDLKFLLTHFNQRTIYGSDFPETGLVECRETFERLCEEARVDATAKLRIARDNLAKLLGTASR